MKKFLKLSFIAIIAFFVLSLSANTKATTAMGNDKWVIAVNGNQHYIYNDSPSFTENASRFTIRFETSYGSSGMGVYSLYRYSSPGVKEYLYQNATMPHGEETVTVIGYTGEFYLSANGMYYDVDVESWVIDTYNPIINDYKFTIRTVELFFLQGQNNTINPASLPSVFFKVVNPNDMVSMTIELNGGIAVPFSANPLAFDYQEALPYHYMCLSKGHYKITITDVWGATSVYQFGYTSDLIVDFIQGQPFQTNDTTVAFKVTSFVESVVFIYKNYSPAVPMAGSPVYDYHVVNGQYMFIAEGYYAMLILDIFGGYHSVNFTIRFTAPTVYFNNVEATSTQTLVSVLQTGGLVATFDGNGRTIVSATYEYNFGSPVSFTSGQTFKAVGNYVFKVTDDRGKTTTVSAFVY